VEEVRRRVHRERVWRAHFLRGQGKTHRDIAAAMGISRTLVAQLLREKNDIDEAEAMELHDAAAMLRDRVIARYDIDLENGTAREREEHMTTTQVSRQVSQLQAQVTRLETLLESVLFERGELANEDVSDEGVAHAVDEFLQGIHAL
jgi:plasmid maintenance system antidote protein VapI